MKLSRQGRRQGVSHVGLVWALCLIWLANSSLFISKAAADSNAGKPPLRSLKILAIDTGRPMLTAADGDSQQVFELSSTATVRRNGVPDSIESISSGDTATFELDDRQRVVSIEVTSLHAGIILNVDPKTIEITSDYTDKQRLQLAGDARVLLNDSPARIDDLRRGDRARISPNHAGLATRIEVTRSSVFAEFWENFRHNLFKPLLLFFYLGFAVPLLKVAFEFPRVIYQGLTIYLLVAIGWHGGEELAELSGGVLREAIAFMAIGFCTNFVIGVLAYAILRRFISSMRRVDAATVAAYYGSDSAGTFVTCLGVLAAASIKYAAYMPVMLAVMEIPGCLVGLFLVSRLRCSGMDALGNMPDERGYEPCASSPLVAEVDVREGHDHKTDHERAVEREARMALENIEDDIESQGRGRPNAIFNAELLHEVFLNPGLFLLFGGIVIGFVSRLQGHKVTDANDSLFVTLFQGVLCLFLLEMGMTASNRLRDLKTAGWRFIVFGLLAPNIFATIGICVAHCFSFVAGTPLQLGTYVLFAVLCAAASYIAVPAIQRIAIPEASPTLPLAASLGLTFSYNVTVGIPIYLMIAQLVIMALPVE